MKKFQKKTLRELEAYLADMGLSIYGPHMEGDTQYPGCMDYDAEAIIERRKLKDSGKLKKANEPW